MTSVSPADRLPEPAPRRTEDGAPDVRVLPMCRHPGVAATPEDGSHLWRQVAEVDSAILPWQIW
jgi:hypothetical protein